MLNKQELVYSADRTITTVGGNEKLIPFLLHWTCQAVKISMSSLKSMAQPMLNFVQNSWETGLRPLAGFALNCVYIHMLFKNC